jgi:hypothetical protein
MDYASTADLSNLSVSWSEFGRANEKNSRDDKTAIELFRRGVVELQTSKPNICGHVVAVLA